MTKKLDYSVLMQIIKMRHAKMGWLMLVQDGRERRR